MAEKEKITCQFKSEYDADYNCPEPPLEDSEKGYCIFHEAGKKDIKKFIQRIIRKLDKKDYDFRGYWFPEGPIDSEGFDLKTVKQLGKHGGFEGILAFAGPSNSKGVGVRTHRRLSDRQRFNKEGTIPYGGGGYFIGITFDELADFEAATFEGSADFKRVTFRGGGNFERTTFKGPVRFGGLAGYDYRTFVGLRRYIIANSSLIRWDDDLERYGPFSPAGERLWEKATFEGPASFKSATFEGSAYFEGTVFQGPTDFREATFRGFSNFRRATFEKSAYLEGITFEKIIVLDQVRFRIPRSVDILFRKAKTVWHREGNYVEEGKCHYQEMDYIRKQKRWDIRYIWANLFHRCLHGYGEKPHRVILWATGIIITCALLFMNFGIGETRFFGANLPTYNIFKILPKPYTLSWVDLANIGRYFYFSVVTFTTLGYGDLRPVHPISHLISSIEAFTGMFMMALFVLTFGRKWRR